MLSRQSGIIRYVWATAGVATPFGAVYCLLLCLLTDAIEAFGRLPSYGLFLTWGGVEDLFVLNSVVLGWASVVAWERMAGIAGAVLLLFALPSCIAAIGGGFVVALVFLPSLSDPVWEMAAYSLVSVLGASIVRVYLGKIL